MRWNKSKSSIITSLMLPRKPMEMEYNTNALPCKQTIRKWVQSSSLHLRCLLGLLSCFRLRDYISQHHAMKWSHVHQTNRWEPIQGKTPFQNIQKIMHIYFSYFIVVSLCKFVCLRHTSTRAIIRLLHCYPDNKVHGANMGPIWASQDPGEPHVGPMNFAIL